MEHESAYCIDVRYLTLSGKTETVYCNRYVLNVRNIDLNIIIYKIFIEALVH